MYCHFENFKISLKNPYFDLNEVLGPVGLQATPNTLNRNFLLPHFNFQGIFSRRSGTDAT
jgi:hypothetical protein